MDGSACRRRCQMIATTLLLFSLALGLTYFSWQGLTNLINVGKSNEVKEDGSFNGKELKSELGLHSAAAARIGFNDASVQADEHSLVEGAAWSSSNSSLYCGPNKMKFKVMGPGADELQLYMGKADPVPVSRMHETCGILVKRMLVGLILLVPYDGCGVQQNGTYVLTMRWRKSDVNITCNMLTNSVLNTTTEPVDYPLKMNLSHRSLHRIKRYFRWRSMYGPCYQRHRFPFFLFSTPAPTTTTTTAAPPMYPPLIYHPFLQKLLEYYPLYAHYFQKPRYHLHPYYHAPIHPDWHKYFQTTPKPLFAHSFQKILSEYFTTTMMPTTVTKPTVISSTDCPQPRSGPLPKHRSFNFGPRVLYGTSKNQQNEQNYRSGYKRPDNPDSFWESFPLLHYSTSVVDPDLGGPDA